MGPVETAQMSKHHKDEENFCTNECEFKKVHWTSMFPAEIMIVSDKMTPETSSAWILINGILLVLSYI